MWIANERALRFDQFFASQKFGGGFGGTSGDGGVDEEQDKQNE